MIPYLLSICACYGVSHWTYEASLHSQVGFQFHPKCKKQKIVQLSFADDLVFFLSGDKDTIMHLFACFQEFPKASELIANMDRSCIYFGGVPGDTQVQILAKLNFLKERYLSDIWGAPQH